MSDVWKHCVEVLRRELTPQQFNTWILPLQAEQRGDRLYVLAPNRFVLDWVRDRFAPRIEEQARAAQALVSEVQFTVGSFSAPEGAGETTHEQGRTRNASRSASSVAGVAAERTSREAEAETEASAPPARGSSLLPHFTFETFIEGKSNQLAHAAARQVAGHSEAAYNPLMICGGVGLGKTHLIHAAGHAIRQRLRGKQVIYLHSERFVREMVTALRRGTIEQFKHYYRSIDVLLVDDIQFFADKDRSQEEFFHIFNALLDSSNQVIMTCDKYPNQVKGLDSRLKSRFGWGLTVAIEPPELETRVAIVLSKAAQKGVELPHDVAFFIGKRMHSNVRELEGALHRVMAFSNFTKCRITVETAREALEDLLAAQEKQLSVSSIKSTVTEYYRVRLADLEGPSRKRNLVRPRHMAMALAKELTTASLGEIGAAFGGRDHSTVRNAVQKVAGYLESDSGFAEDYKILTRLLTA